MSNAAPLSSTSPSPKFSFIYHDPCNDGFAAATALVMWAKRLELEYDLHPCNYEKPLPDVAADSLVIMADFSFPPDQMIELASKCRGVIMLDHHLTAARALPELREKIKSTKARVVPYINQTWSGAVLAYAFTQVFGDNDGNPPEVDASFEYPNGFNLAMNNHLQSIPKLFQYVQDRDLWQWSLPLSREFSEGLMLYPQTFDDWEDLVYNFDWHFEHIVTIGKAAITYRDKILSSVIPSRVFLMKIGGFVVPTVNLPGIFGSEAGNLLSKDQPFAASFSITGNEVLFSLRSTSPEGMDVAQVATIYGGGGHKNAAGFHCSLEKFSSMIVEGE